MIIFIFATCTALWSAEVVFKCTLEINFDLTSREFKLSMDQSNLVKLPPAHINIYKADDVLTSQVI